MSKTTRGYPFRPDYAVAPGETLRDRLSEIDVSQADLAARSGLSTKHVNQIIQGIAPITQETALILERVTGTPASIWNKLEASYRETLLRAKQRELTPADRKWLTKIPVQSLQKRGNLPKGTNTGRLFEAALAFFGVGDRDAWERIWTKPVGSFKRTKAFRSDPGAVASWMRIGQLEARKIATEPYSVAAFRRALQEVRRLTRQPDTEALVQTCAAAGVAVVFVKELDKCRISGATWWASPTRAVIALSDRYKSDDQIWFTFFHEAAHILLHSKKETFIDDGSEDDDLEEEANRYARDTLVPPEAAKRLATLTTDTDVRRFATEIGIATGIVVGRLQHDHHPQWPWTRGHNLKRKVHIVDED